MDRPFRYLISGLLSTVTGGGLPVVCADNEFISITPNTGTCEEYLGPYIAQFGGYLSNPTDAAACQFCNYENGDQFLSTLQVEYSNRWRNLVSVVSFPRITKANSSVRVFLRPIACSTSS